MSDTEGFPAFDAERSAAIRRLVLDQIPAPQTSRQRRSREGRPALIGMLTIMALFVVGGVYLAVHGVQAYSSVGGEQDAVATSSASPAGSGTGSADGPDAGAGTNDGAPLGRAVSGTNARGQTYGPPPTTSSTNGTTSTTALPDLVLEHGTSAGGALVTGYVPATVYTDAPVDSVVPLYASDGTTKVGTWVVKRSGSPSR